MVTFSSLGLTLDELAVTCHPPKLLFWLSLEAIFNGVCFLSRAGIGKVGDLNFQPGVPGKRGISDPSVHLTSWSFF